MHVLAVDTELAEAVPADQRARALRLVTAPVLRLRRGAWDAARALADPSGVLGLLVLDAIVWREAVVGPDARAAEILGRGDVLRTWDAGAGVTSLDVEVAWEVLEPGAVAIIDRRCREAMAPWPALGAALVARAWRRSAVGAVILAGSHRPAEYRVLQALWLLAERWGTVRPDGVHLGLRLTHERIARLIASRRPTVTLAVRELREAGALSTADGWVLHRTVGELAAAGWWPRRGRADDQGLVLREGWPETSAVSLRRTAGR